MAREAPQAGERPRTEEGSDPRRTGAGDQHPREKYRDWRAGRHGMSALGNIALSCTHLPLSCVCVVRVAAGHSGTHRVASASVEAPHQLKNIPRRVQVLAAQEGSHRQSTLQALLATNSQH